MALLHRLLPTCGAPSRAQAARRRWLQGCAAILLALCGSAHALSPDRALSQLRHDRWTPDEGAPAQIMAITQTPDGFLWLGSRQGIYRFDGVRFERITDVAGKRLADDDVLSLMAEADGSVWAGYFNGGMSRIGGPRPAHYEYQRDDVPTGSVIGFARDAAGRLWAATPDAVVWLDPATDTWKTAEDIGFDRSWSPQRLFADRERGLWVSFETPDRFGIARLAPGAARFAPIARPVQAAYLGQAPDGRLWAADYWGVRPLAQAQPDPRHPRATVSWLVPELKSGGLRFDRDGAMWLSTSGGIARVRAPSALRAPGHDPAPHPEYFGTAQGLTSEVVWTLFEDREGNVWAGTANGLDRFRDNALAPIRLPRRDQVFSIAPDQGGRIWVGNPDGGPMRIAPDPAQPGGAMVEEWGELGLQGVSALHRDAHGTLWVGGGAGGLWRSRAGKPEPIALPKDFDLRGRVVMIASDRDGGLWVSKVGAGLLRLHHGRWEDQNARYGLQRTTPRALVEDAQGRIWSDAGQTIRVFDNGARRDFKDDGPGIGRISVLHRHGEELWMGGLQGVSMRRGDRFHRLLGRNAEAFERTTGIVLLPDGEAWIAGRTAITRVPAAQMRRWRADPAYLVDFERFGVADGLRGAAEHTGSSLSAVADDQGRVWFATNRGVHWIDPRRIARNPATPAQPVLLGLQVDERPMPLAGPLRLPVGSRNLRIDYTAPSLRMPERVRFRYRLEGFDNRWYDAGTSRQALYPRLAPGSYRFRLIASDDAGRWSRQEATLAFTVPPAFWQTWWFALLCLLLAAASIALLVRWRVAIAGQRAQRIYRARADERERIARDLHDSVLQSVQALVWRVEAAQARLSRGEAAAAETALAHAVQEASAGLVEGRERIAALRGQDTAQDLETALRDLPRQLQFPPHIAYAFATRGRARRWSRPEQAELYGVAREAVGNALRHAGAARISVLLAHGFWHTTLEISDDGRGLDPEVRKRGSREGHWGLPGMRERAALLGGTLVLAPRPGGGTRVRLRLPRWRLRHLRG